MSRGDAYRISTISAASPDMEEDAFCELVDDIRQHGQLVPIVTCGDEVIDGRKRFRACEILGIKPRVIDVSPSQDATALSYSLNILRTHYTPSQRAMFAARRATFTRRDAIMFRHHGTTANSQLKQTVEKAAETAGISPTEVHQAKRIRRGAVPEVTAAVESGRLTLHSAEQIMRTVPKEEQAKTVEQVIKASRGKQRQTPVRAVLGQSTGYRHSPKRALHLRIDRTLDQLDNAVDSIGRLFDEPGTKQHQRFRQWLEQVTEARNSLAKIIRQGGA